jgi:F-type H+-transporting ATPase subunit b
MTMNGLNVVALAQGGGPIADVARTFGVDWPHLIAQTISFGIVCTVLYLLAYKPILRMLAARREQIAGGLANAAQIEAKLKRIDAERVVVLQRAEEEGRLIIEDARAAGAHLRAHAEQEAVAVAQQIEEAARTATERERTRVLSDARREVGRLVIQTSAAVVGKILTAEDHRRLTEETAQGLGA